MTTTPTIVREDNTAWWVACHGGCGRTITVPRKVTWPDGRVEVADAPEARRCAVCGPFPR